MVTPSKPFALAPRARFHLRLGWGAVLVFVVLGTALEALHGFKIAFYLDVENEVRRLLWTLAHAHGALLGLVNVAFAATVHLLDRDGPRLGGASRALVLGTVLLPLGFFLGGFGITEGDPGAGVVLAPLGALSLLAGLTLLVWELAR